MPTWTMISRITFGLHRLCSTAARRDAAARWEFVRAELSSSARVVRRRMERHRERVEQGRVGSPAWWNAPTAAFPQVGRAGWLTPAQSWRADGGRWHPAQVIRERR